MRCPLPNSSRSLPAPTYHARPRRDVGLREKNRPAWAFFALLGAASPAGAEIPGFSGTYGVDAGCEVAKTKQWEEFFSILTKDHVETGLSHCEFTGRPKRIVGGFSTDATCSEEGEDKKHASVIDILQNGDLYTVRFADGLEWGPFEKCQ
jgi:hypothetical protein